MVKGDLADKMPTNEAVGRAFTPSGNDSDDPVVVSSAPDTAQVSIVAEADAGTGTGADAGAYAGPNDPGDALVKTGVSAGAALVSFLTLILGITLTRRARKTRALWGRPVSEGRVSGR